MNIYPLLDLACCGFFSWVCFSVWFLFALFKYVNILSCSLFLSFRGGTSQPCFWLWFKEVECTDELFCPDASFCHILSLNLHLGCNSSYLSFSWLKAVVCSELCRLELWSLAEEGLSCKVTHLKGCWPHSSIKPPGSLCTAQNYLTLSKWTLVSPFAVKNLVQYRCRYRHFCWIKGVLAKFRPGK